MSARNPYPSLSILKILLAVSLFALAGSAVFLVLRHPEILGELVAWIRQSGWRGPFAFIGLYAVGAMIFLPGSVLTIAGGALFGPVAGPIYSLAGAVIGATLSFLVARYGAHAWLSARLSGRMHALVARMQTGGWRLVALTRLIPLLPFGIVNYGLGVLGLRLAHFVIASALCMAPGTVAYSYMGYVGQQAWTQGEPMVFKIAIGILALLGLIAIPFVVDWVRSRPTPIAGIERTAP